MIDFIICVYFVIGIFFGIVVAAHAVSDPHRYNVTVDLAFVGTLIGITIMWPIVIILAIGYIGFVFGNSLTPEK